MVKNKKMENGEITYMVKLTFHEDEERQVKEFNLTVPASVELMRVVDVLNYLYLGTAANIIRFIPMDFPRISYWLSFV